MFNSDSQFHEFLLLFFWCLLKYKYHEGNLTRYSHCSLKAETLKRAEALFFFYKFIHFCKGIKIYLGIFWNVSSAFLWWKNDLSQRVCKTSLVDQTICYYIFHSGSVWRQYILDFLINFKLLRWTQNIFSTGSVVKHIWCVIHYS